MNIYYKNRRTQMIAFGKIYKKGKESLAATLRNACMCGASEERFRTCNILRTPGITIDEAASLIMSESIDKVLGYEKP